MKVLIVNPILYTSETHEVKKVNSIKDTMIYDLCLAFHALGHEVTLIGAEDYRPTEQEDDPFEVRWLETKWKKICFPNVLPYCPELKRVIRENTYDLIITSEVFSLNSLMLARRVPNKLIVWHELAKHNRMLRQLPSKLWYGIVARLCFRRALVVPRSEEAKAFISAYCQKVSDEVIDHGVNLDKFTPCYDKDNLFAVSSQLIQRKQIDKILIAFGRYLQRYDSTARLVIMGDGEEAPALKAQAQTLGIADNVTFTGKISHDRLITTLQKAKAMLVYTRKDNNMVSIVESIAVCTPVVTTTVPYNAGYIKANGLGIVNDHWNEDDLHEVAESKDYITACAQYRESLATKARAAEFIKIKERYLD